MNLRGAFIPGQPMRDLRPPDPGNTFVPPSALHAMRRIIASAFVLVIPCSAIAAQGGPADYARAESLAARVRGKVVNAVSQTNWIGRTPWVWYRKTTPTGTAYMLVDAEHQQKNLA